MVWHSYILLPLIFRDVYDNYSSGVSLFILAMQLNGIVQNGNEWPCSLADTILCYLHAYIVRLSYLHSNPLLTYMASANNL